MLVDTGLRSKSASQHYFDGFQFDVVWNFNKFLKTPLINSWKKLQGSFTLGFSSIHFSRSVVYDSCDPMDCNMQASLSITNSRSLLKLMSIESVMPSNHLILCCPLLLLPSIFPSIPGSFPMSQFFTSGGQNIGVSASSLVLPMNIQGWFPLGLIGLISLQSNRLSKVFSNTTVQKHQFFGIQLSLRSNSHICTWLLEKS